MKQLLTLLSLFFLAACAPKMAPVNTAATPVKQDPSGLPTIAAKTNGMTALPGYFNYWWDEKEGKIWLEIKDLDKEFLYVNTLPAGVGSNDIGLDRGQIGNTRIVKFQRSGPKVLLVQPNYAYRAVSQNPLERRSVEEAFAQSVLWGFTAAAQENGRWLIDFTPFLLNDAHDVSGVLARTNQGSYRLEGSRSAVYLDRTKNFPQNSEWEATLTFIGEPKGDFIRSVTPTPANVTVRQHYSFVQLPDDGYQPRTFDPRSGFFSTGFADYAQPVGAPLYQRYIVRHRLQKKDPTAAVSDPVQPIVYYMDPGCPEPVKSALMQGASWWNQAFEAAGYRNAFIVKELPADADPMDVRYNLIQWVHRSTRGWSYGSTVADPRTGEIIKGQVSLGSLRVRQDYLIAQGLRSPFGDGRAIDPVAVEMALARLRQLAAHEVGHAIGLAHNFAASTNDRASVMDYPHPYVALQADGNLDFAKAYATGIGAWDKRAILYGYQDFPSGQNKETALQNIIQATIASGLDYISDDGARAPSTAHPFAHLWDGGADAVTELQRISAVRAAALARFGENSIPPGAVMADLERTLVPLYLSHRYQVEAVSKIIGGVEYTYAVKGDGQKTNTPAANQSAALAALLKTVQPSYLALPEKTIALIPPQPIEYERDKELFGSRTGGHFDPLAAAEAAAQITLNALLNPERLARVVEQSAREAAPKPPFTLTQLLANVSDALFFQETNSAPTTAMEQEIGRAVQKVFFRRLLELAGGEQTPPSVQAAVLLQLDLLLRTLAKEYNSEKAADTAQRAHALWLLRQYSLFEKDPKQFKLPPVPAIPPGQPIGCDDTF